MEPAIKKRARNLRKRGFSYSQIQEKVGAIPKATLAYWLKDIELSKEDKEKRDGRQLALLAESRKKAIQVNRERRARYLNDIRKRNLSLKNNLENYETAKIALAMLYLGEGGKNIRKAAIVFGNSDPETIKLFLTLLHRCYTIDENKFRCTVQCRADQDVNDLQNFWRNITGIPLQQFYRAQVDKRTEGKPSRKLAYKGVCRIDYFSSEIFHDLLQAISVIKGP